MNRLHTAVILAAGKGERIADILPDRPKGFLEVGGRTLIERALDHLRSVGIKEIIFVTGYRAAYYEALASRHSDIVLIHNPDFETTGSMHSLYCARPYVEKTPFLLLESDLIYEPRALTLLLAYPAQSAVLMSGFTHSGDEVYISTIGDRAVTISKKRNDHTETVTGELVGIMKIAPDIFEALVTYAAGRFECEPDLCYEYAFNGITKHRTIPAHHIENLIWAEIDTPAHLMRVQNHILPRLNDVSHAEK